MNIVFYLDAIFSFIYLYNILRGIQLPIKASLPCGPLQIHNLIQYLRLR